MKETHQPGPDDPATVLVHEGWRHMGLKRPLAARSSWLRALRIDPDHKAAKEALELLSTTGRLPKVARVEHRFRSPATEDRRKRWDRALRSGSLVDLDRAADVFLGLAEEDRDDADAWYNHALGLAWGARNLEAVEALERSVRLDAAAANESKAVEAWTLAELLRHGYGANEIADDVNYLLTMIGPAAADPDFRRLLLTIPEIREIGNLNYPGERMVYAWLDRPWTADVRRPSEVRRVLAHLTLDRDLLLLASPDPVGLEPLAEEVEARSGGVFERRTTPLALTMLDAAAWSVLIPTELPPEEHARLRRGALEHYFEDLWITRPRHGLDGRTPLEAGRAAATDPVARAKLLAAVAFREQILERSAALLSGQGYHFDRLRRRLGLPLADPEAEAFAADDVSCMSEKELDALDPSALNDSRLSDACESVLPLRDDARSARFASALAGRGAKALAFVDRKEMFAALIRTALEDEGTSRALAWLDLADEADRLHHGRDGRTFATWRAEIHARSGDGDEAARVYREICDANPEDPAPALDAAETLTDRGFDELAEPFAALARDRAEAVGDPRTALRARRMLAEDDDR